MNSAKFSNNLETWLNGDSPKTLAGLTSAFPDKSFAVIYLLLMITPALPLPTGGVTHIFELVTMLLALQFTFGIRRIWLPKRFRERTLGESLQKNVIPSLLRQVRRVENLSRPRLRGIFKTPTGVIVMNFLVFCFALAAFFAPPFTGLDTLPSLGAVLVALAIIFEDAIILATGVVMGALGIGVEIGLSSAVYHLFSSG